MDLVTALQEIKPNYLPLAILAAFLIAAAIFLGVLADRALKREVLPKATKRDREVARLLMVWTAITAVIALCGVAALLVLPYERARSLENAAIADYLFDSHGLVAIDSIARQGDHGAELRAITADGTLVDVAVDWVDPAMAATLPADFEPVVVTTSEP